MPKNRELTIEMSEQEWTDHKLKEISLDPKYDIPTDVLFRFIQEGDISVLTEAFYDKKNSS